ncbi:MAG: hypothetical protein ACE5RR_02445, partial [Nitrosarchaeum sp.]
MSHGFFLTIIPSTTHTRPQTMLAPKINCSDSNWMLTSVMIIFDTEGRNNGKNPKAKSPTPKF